MCVFPHDQSFTDHVASRADFDVVHNIEFSTDASGTFWDLKNLDDPLRYANRMRLSRSEMGAWKLAGHFFTLLVGTKCSETIGIT